MSSRNISAQYASSENLKSPKRKKKKRKKHKDLFDIPGVKKIELTELAQKIIGCVAGDNVTAENPWTLVPREPITDNLDLHEESSEFLPIKTDILLYPRSQFLMGYIPDESKEKDEFYICTTEEAADTVKSIIEKMKQQQEERLYNTLNKTVRDWIPMGTAIEVDESLIKNNRPLIEVEIESQYPIFSPKPEFEIIKAENRRDGYVELKWTSDELVANVYRKRIDRQVQAAAQFVTTEVQTICTYPSNSATQYFYEMEDTSQLVEVYAKSIKQYAEDNMENLSDLLRVNASLNLHSDDYTDLINKGSSFLTGTTVEEVKEYMSFMDVNLCKDKMIADVVWHPMWSGTVALAYMNEAPFIYHFGSNTEDSVTKAVHGINPTLIWSCLDGLKPKLILESPREVTKLAFCKFDENVLVGGLTNGQIIIWDIRNKLQKVEELEVLTTAQQKYRAYMHSLMTWMKNIHDLSVVRPTAISDLRYSHKAPITGINWLSPYYEFSRLGTLTEIPEDTEKSMQFLTSSEDGNIMIWDLLKKPTVQPGGFKPRRLRRLKQRPSALMVDVSPYKIYHLNLKPIYKITIPRMRKLPLAISSSSENYCTMKYAEIGPSKSKKAALNERTMYKPIFNRDDQTPVTPTMFIGSMEGDYLQVKWEGQDFDSGEVVNSEYGVIVTRARYHDGPINSIQKSPTQDIILTVGGRVFALWTPELPDRPVLWRKRKHLYTSGEWNVYEPHLFTIKVTNGDVECWSLAYDTKYPSFSLPFSSGFLTASAFHSLQLKKQIYGAGDKLGSFRLFYVPEDTAPGSNEMKCEKFKLFMNRELDRKRKFMHWQKEWFERNQQLLIDRGTEEQDLHEKEVEEQKVTQAENLEKKSAADAADDEAHKKGPQPGKYVEWVIAQRQAQEEARIKATIISKKQLDTKELEKRRKPLQKLDEENERKKRKQKQRLKEGETIFQNTVASLFPEIVKEKTVPPPDPYFTSEIAPEELERNYNEFRDLGTYAGKFIGRNPYNYRFYWKQVIANGKKRRETLANLNKEPSKRARATLTSETTMYDEEEEIDEEEVKEGDEEQENREQVEEAEPRTSK